MMDDIGSYGRKLCTCVWGSKDHFMSLMTPSFKKDESTLFVGQFALFTHKKYSIFQNLEKTSSLKNHFC